MNRLSADIAHLRRASRQFDGSIRARKARLLARIAKCLQDITDPADIISLHESLLFIAAFPDDAKLHAAAERSLRKLGAICRSMAERVRRSARRLTNTGMAETTIEYAFSLDALDWLVHAFPRDVDLAWKGDSLGEAFEDALAILAFRVEYDGVIDPRYTVREWMTLAGMGRGGRGRTSDAASLCAMFDQIRHRISIDERILDQFFDSLDITIRWTLRNPIASRTLCRFPARPIFTHASGTRPSRRTTKPDTDDILRTPLLKPARLNAATKRGLIDAARAALAARTRETDPVTHAHERDVVLHQLDRGIDVLLLGMRPERRLPIEGFIGYVAAKNRIPIAYGGGWIAFDVCTIGINLFETFRGGESSLVFAQILRVYHQAFGVRIFRVDPYQFGEGNEEASRSGAFWFYHRFGFRPSDQSLHELAQREAEKIARQKGYRSSLKILRTLARSRMEMKPAGNADDAAASVDLGSASLAVTRWIASRFAGNRSLAESAAIKIVCRSLGISARSRLRWPAAERASFESLSLLVAAIADVHRWPARDRADLLRLMRAKGGPSEMAYLRRLRQHSRLHDAMLQLPARTARNF